MERDGLRSTDAYTVPTYSAQTQEVATAPSGSPLVAPLPEVGPTPAAQRRWISSLDPLSKPYGERGTAFSEVANTLNNGGILPWRTDRKHVQDRLRVLMDARRVSARSAMESTGADDKKFDEAEYPLDDLLDENEERQESERLRRA